MIESAFSSEAKWSGENKARDCFRPTSVKKSHELECYTVLLLFGVTHLVLYWFYKICD